MIKIENTNVCGFEAAIRGMRNPMNSWDKSDSSELDCNLYECEECQYEHLCEERYPRTYEVGENDLALMRKLAHAGDDHGKFARFINVTADITAPLYLWSEIDTYKVGTVANSCSKMHKLMDKEFTLEDFSHEHLLDGGLQVLKQTIDALNKYRDYYLTTKNKEFWWQAIQLLPNSYNQRRTVQLNYQVLNRIYHARKNHKLDEWHVFCDWIEELPWFKDIYLLGADNEEN